MPLTLGVQFSSLIAQRQLKQNGEALSGTFERLSSGLRINNASDDAAGFAIADGLRADRTVYAQGVRNLNDGISAFNIADSAIGELIDIVTRIEELAGQAANGTLTDSQREALDSEAQSLSEEFVRISNTTDFNDINFFDGSMQSGLRLQAGYGSAGSILGYIGGALADGTFSSSSSVTFSANTYELVNADINGDGNLDIVSANGTNVSISLGTGGGSFSSPTTFVGGSGTVNDLILADFDGDGEMDIATASSSLVSIFTGNGDGTFTSAGTAAFSGVVGTLVAGDFNGDGNMDIAANDYGVATTRILEGNGDGTISETSSYVIGRAYDMEVGDINGDGILDIVSNDYSSGELDALIGDGNGGFLGTTPLPGSPSLDFELADLNGDGIDDLLIGDLGLPTIDAYINDGTGTFTNTFSELVSFLPQKFEAGDFNGDGILDFVSANYDESDLTIYLGDGTGDFNPQSSTLPSTVTNVTELTLGDFNNDGVLDIFSGGLGTQSDVHLGNSVDGINPILPFSLLTRISAKQALAPLEHKREVLSLQQGVIGAFLSRADSTLQVLEAVGGEYEAAESRIRDADVASEVAELTRLQILNQATTAVLAQANQQSSLVLSLLD